MKRFTTRLALSDAQLEIWSGLGLFPLPGLHDLTVAFGLVGIDPANFEESLREVVTDEPLLRARLGDQESGPALAIDRPAEGSPAGPQPPSEASFRHRDLRGLKADEQDRAVAAEARVPLDPGWSLFRSVLFRVDDARYVWLLVIHHLIADGWSIKLLLDRVSARLSAESRRRPSPQIAQRDLSYSARVGTRVRQYKKRADEIYWRRRLSSPRAPLDLYGTPTSAVPGVDRLETRLTCETSALLRDAAASYRGRSSDIALSNLIAAALAVYLNRVSGATEISLGMPFANRHGEAEREHFGLLMRIGVVSLTIDPEEKIDALVRRVAAETEEASRHLASTPANTRNRFFEVMLNYHNVRYPTIGLEPVTERWFHSANDTLPLTVHIRTSQADGALLLQLDLQRDRFSPEVQEDAMRHFLHVLTQVGRRRDLRVMEVELEERKRLIELYGKINATFRELPSRTIESLFRRRVAERGDRPAILETDGAVTSFAELDERSDRVARYLRACGVRRGDGVAAYLPRSTRAVVALLATVKAGGIWIPLDPSNPPARVLFMLRDSGARVLLSDGPRAEKISSGSSDESLTPQLVILDETGLPTPNEGRDVKGQVGEGSPPSDTAILDEPAYCLYTSGSTGLPKGVLGSRRTVLNRLNWMWRTIPLEPGEVLLHKTSISFIDSLWEVFGGLLAGHGVAIASDEEVRDPIALAPLLARFPIRRIVLVPSLLALLVNEAERTPGLLDGIRHWFVTGELLSPATVAGLRTLCPTAEIYNLYGTSETFDAACCRVSSIDTAESYLPIGAPIDNTRLYVVDEAMNPLPPLVRGELLVGGAHVPAEYLHRPELTPSRFIPQLSFDQDIGGPRPAALFRTGDIARLRRDGTFECIGRRDRQVKVRGFRVELEEVERTLEKHPGVERAAAVALDGAREERLVAVVRLKEGTSAAAVRAYLKKQLPSWMIPELQPIDDIPLTPSGKMDRVRLKEILSGHAAAAAESIHPRSRSPRDAEHGNAGMSAEERQLAALWRRLLRVQEVAPQDDFFEIGGTSLLAVRLVAEVEHLFGKRIPLSALFEASTLEEFARAHLAPRHDAGSPAAATRGRALPRIDSAALSAAARRSRTALRPAAEPVIHSPRESDDGRIQSEGHGSLPLFSVPPAGTTISAFAGLARLLPSDQPLYSFQPRGVEAGEKPLESIRELAREYVSQIRDVQPHGPYLLIGRCFGGYVAYEMAQRLLAEGEEIGALIIIDSREAPLDRDGERLHTGIRKLVAYYPSRVAYFVRRRRLAYTLRMKAKNEVRYRLARIFCFFAASGIRAREHRLRLLRHLHTLAYHRYVARPIDCPITMIWAGASPDLTDERQKWLRLARKGIDWHTIDCDHHDLMKGRNLEQVAEVIKGCAAKVGAAGKVG